MTTLSAALRERTAAAHRRVEGTPFVRALIAGRIERSSYALLLRSLHEIYAALETALAQQPALAPLRHPALGRGAALAEDLQALHGPRWHAELGPRPAAQHYATHLADLADRTPLLLAAHAYVRYLGDLSGGQLLQRAVQRGLALGGDAGTCFYRFDAPVAQLAQGLRGALDALALDATDQHAIVDEAAAAFGRHERLFVELQAAR